MCKSACVRNTFGETTMKHVVKSVKTVQRSAYASESTPCCYCCLCFCNGCCRGLAGVLSMSRWTLVSPMRNILLRYLQTIHHPEEISTVGISDFMTSSRMCTRSAHPVSHKSVPPKSITSSVKKILYSWHLPWNVWHV